ncbi:MAG: hypothetical protein ACXVEF_22290, partial [Polyangiales bacterium]
DAEVRVRGRAGAEEGEIREAVAIATELVGNVAKHGAGRVSIDVDLRIARVQGKSEDRGPWGPRGRGLRNIELRAQARGGTMSIDRRHGLVIVTCAWPPRGIADVRWWRRSPMLVECSAIFIAVTPLLFHGRPLTGIVTTALALAYAGHNVHTRERTVTNRRMELLRALEARHAMEQADILALVERGCAAAVDALSHASAGEDAREIERAITTLAECVSDLLWALESDATPDETAAELHELARARGTIFSGAPLHTPHDRFAARRQLRVIVAAEPIRSEGSAASRWR